MDILTAVDRYGLPLIVVALVATFTKRDLWPFLVAQTARWQDERRAEREAFTNALRNLTQVAEAGHAARAERDRALYDQLHAMTQAIAEVAIITRELQHAIQVGLNHTTRRKPAA